MMTNEKSSRGWAGEQIRSVVGDDRVQYLSPGAYVVDWESDSHGKDALLSRLIAPFTDVVVDVEEAITESPCELDPLHGVRGAGRVCRVRETCHFPSLLEWLRNQQWLLLAGHELRQGDGVRLHWNVAQCFNRPDPLHALLKEVEANVAVMAYFDDVAWLIVVR